VEQKKDDFFEHALVVEGTVRRREYQTRIAARALSASTLVVLPTGLGKTVVALIVIAERLHRGNGGVLMMAPTKPLVEQHRSFLESHLVDRKVTMLTGEVGPAKRAQVYSSADILVATPQVIKNDLVSGDLDLTAFSTLVVDEAHRAVGDYPYSFIAEMYYKARGDGLLLGLTASPGHDVSRIYEVCRNLGIEDIEVRVDSDPDVRPYIQEIDVQYVRVEVSSGTRALIMLLERMYLDKVQKLQRLGVLRQGKATSVKELIAAAGRIQEYIRRGERGGAYYQAMSLQAQAMKVSHAMELAETQGPGALYQYMDRLLKETGSPDSSRASKAVVSDPLFSQVMNRAQALLTEEHPKVEAVVRFVRQGLREDPASRIIVFTHFRDTASTVLERLKGFEEQGIKPVRFVGQASRGEDAGLSQKQQKGLLDDFRAGKFNVLIATSVAEEGLDIPGADLVVFFEPIPSEIRTIQRRGRTGRHSSGKVVVLMSKETRDVAYSFSAKDKEARMERQLLTLRKMISKAPLKRKEEGARERVTLESFTPPEAKAPEGPIVHTDQREMVSAVVEGLVRRGVNVRPVQAGDGDYIVSDRCVLERKTAQDLADSLVDGRLFDQVTRLRERYERPILVVEGDDPFTKRNITREAMMGAIASIALDYNVPVVFTRDPAETAELVMAASKREAGRGGAPRVSRGPKGGDSRSVQLAIVASLPGISTKLAGRLLDRFGSVEAVFRATEEELSEVEGIGKSKARQVRSVLIGDNVTATGS